MRNEANEQPGGAREKLRMRNLTSIQWDSRGGFSAFPTPSLAPGILWSAALYTRWPLSKESAFSIGSLPFLAAKPTEV